MDLPGEKWEHPLNQNDRLLVRIYSGKWNIEDGLKSKRRSDMEVVHYNFIYPD